MAAFEVRCLLCDAAFTSESALLEHTGGLPLNSDDEPFWCSCGVSYCSPQVRLVKNAVKVLLLKTPPSSKLFQREALQAHCESSGHSPEDAGFEEEEEEPTPTADGEVICPLCGSGFASDEALRAHCGGEVPDEDDEPHWCSCGRSFCSAAALVSHTEALGHEAEVYEEEISPDNYEALSALDENNYRRGMSEAAKAKFVQRSRRPSEALEDPITKEAVEADSTLIVLPCDHVFVKSTLWRWFETHRTCPVCRLELEE